ncbi:MAG: PEGA domain-containing protein [Methanoregula sp.]|nr:PEGA domain-containing protein [Methanoregula sp.]
MVGLNNIKKTAILVLLAALLFVMPSAAFNTAIYGDTSGFNPDLHKDNFTVVYSLPGSPGSDLDTNITKYTDPSIDVIFMGGDDTFSAATASQLEQAVASGKIFVVSNKNYQKFNSSLPATANGSVPDGQYLAITDPNTTLSKLIFNGLRTNFPNTDPLSSRLNLNAKEGSVTLLSYDQADPALLYGKYGNGYVIEWAPVSNTRYLNSTEADLVNYRLITLLANENLPKPIITTPSPTQPNSGSVSVYSSPLGASVLIDGRYYGTTPANLTDIQPGNHIIRLTLSGYYDYEGSIYVLAGQTTHAFGTLPPLNQVSLAPTPVPTTPAPIIVQVPTAQPTQAQAPLENPGVIAAIIGVITATIGAIATIFSHIFKAKKE